MIQILACNCSNPWSMWHHVLTNSSKLEDLSEQVKELQSLISRSQPEANGEKLTSASPTREPNHTEHAIIDSPTVTTELIPFPNVARRRSNSRTQSSAQAEFTPSFRGSSIESPAVSSQRAQSFHLYRSANSRQLGDVLLDQQQTSNLFQMYGAPRSHSDSISKLTELDFSVIFIHTFPF